MDIPNTVKIRNLSALEQSTLIDALELLEKKGNFASSILLEKDAEFIKQLLWIEKGSIA